MQRNALILASFGLIAVAVLAFTAGDGFDGRGANLGGGAFLGAFAGFALYHASFGFTSAWRRLARERRGAGVRAQMALIGLTCLITYPLIGFENLTGWNMHPVVIGMGLSSAFGAFVFGAGMQLGSGCASGTLFTVGGGSVRMLLTLAFFILGSVLATAHMTEFWLQLDDITGIPNIPGTSLVREFGPLGGLLVLLAVLGAIWAVTVRAERSAHGSIHAWGSSNKPGTSLLSGPWSPAAGAVALAAVGVGCFLLFQRPWGVTAGFALWGGKIFQAAGIPVAEWGYWSGWRSNQLEASVFADRTSITNFGILFGSMAAAALAGKFAPNWRLSRRDFLTAVIGGLLMGYGARLAYGCNIGAYLGGIVSGSLHGFWWLIWGFAGSWFGTWLRGTLGMDPPPRSRQSQPAG